MPVSYRKSGESIPCPDGHVLVAVAVPTAGLPRELARKKIMVLSHAMMQIQMAQNVESRTDAEIEAEAAAQVAAAKAARPTGGIE